MSRCFYIGGDIVLTGLHVENVFYLAHCPGKPVGVLLPIPVFYL